MTEWNQAYYETGHGLNFAICCGQLPVLKREEETKWLKEVDSTALQVAVRHLSDAYESYFRYRTPLPVYKKKDDYYQRFVSKQVNQNILVKENQIKLPKIGFVSFKRTRDFHGEIMSVTVTKDGRENYFISILCRETVEEQQEKKRKKQVGIVLGEDGQFYLSDGKVISFVKQDQKYVEKLNYEKAKLEKMRKSLVKQNRNFSGAKNYQKQRKKILRMNEKEANRLEDSLHKLTSELVKEYDTICISTMTNKVSTNSKQKNVLKKIWVSFIHKMRYKAQHAEKQLVSVKLTQSQREQLPSKQASLLVTRIQMFEKKMKSDPTVGATEIRFLAGG